MTETYAAAAPVLETRRPLMTWTAIIGGWLVALGIAWLFYTMGLAVGFSAFDVSDVDAVARGVGIGTIVWIVLTWVVSLFVGGLFASWTDGRADQTVGTLHGVAVWGLAISVTVLLTALGAAGVLQGTGALLGGAVSKAAPGSVGSSRGVNEDSPIGHAAGLLGVQIRRAVGSPNAMPSAAPEASAARANPTSATSSTQASPVNATAGLSQLDAAASRAIAADLLRGRNEDARSRLAAAAAVDPAQADAILKTVAPEADKAKAQLKETADQARRYVAAAMWAAFFSAIIGLIAAALGGWTGAGHIHRVHDGRRF
jgi:hypothetical protein